MQYKRDYSGKVLQIVRDLLVIMKLLTKKSWKCVTINHIWKEIVSDLQRNDIITHTHTNKPTHT